MNEEAERVLKVKDKVLIFGQSDYAARIKEYLRFILKGRLQIYEIVFDLVSDKPDATCFDFNARKKLLKNFDDGILVIVAFSAKYNYLANKFLVENGFTDLILYNSVLDNALKEIYFKELYKSKGLDFEFVENALKNDFMTVYMAKSIYDKGLLKNEDTLSPFVKPIQVGAALTDKKICDLQDDTGDNISEKNKRYCEMTGAYWAWKNTCSKYTGFCHYRRRFEDLTSIAIRLAKEDFDAVLPLPTLANISVYEDYLKRHIPDVYPVMLDVLSDMSPEYYEASKKIFSDKIFYASNMYILRRDILNDFYSWMFPLLFEVEKRIDIKYGLNGNLPAREDGLTDYYNRYAGFVSERLTTLYFIKNADNLKLLYASKIFIVSEENNCG